MEYTLEKIKEVEEEIRKKWEEEKTFESNPDKRKKKFITAAFPYPNSPQHIGHGRTYLVADAYAKYWKKNGYNVLFPMGFHVTGTPIFGMAKRIEEGDKGLIKIFTEIYEIPKEKIEELKDARKLVLYFAKEIEEGMKEIGLGIDWRRKFYTFDAHFNKFIQWQFRKLNEKGLLVKGEHYIAYSPKLDSAVGSHDTKGDVDPEIEEVFVILFETEFGYLPTTTYRPETIYGVTNIWINKNAEYVIAKSEYGNLILSREAFEDLKYQLNLEKVGEIEAEKLLSTKATTPFGEEIPIYHADFVKPFFGTGIVMSVPAHSIHDFVAVKKANLSIIPKKIIQLEGYDIPAKDYAEKFNLEEFGKQLDEKNRELYLLEVEKGFHLPLNLPVKEAREKTKEILKEKNAGFSIYIIANGPIYTRAGDRVVVKKVRDQWFIDYGKPEWKDKARNCLKKMSIIPESARKDFEYAIEWLEKKACTRKKGFGTPFPFDESQIIEPLSDSTIYMAFYTISDKLKEKDVSWLSDEFFDYVFLGKGNGKEEWKQYREAFLYYYPLDSRHSGADLKMNHLTFFIFNHSAIFPEELWPKQIVVNAFVLMEGKKMSKSLGNILPLRKALREFGADTLRIAILAGASLDADTNFSREIAEGVLKRLKFFYKLVDEAKEMEKDEIDEFFYRRLMNRCIRAKKYYEELNFKDVIKELFYDTYEDLTWWEKRSGRKNYKDYFILLAHYLSPIAPFFAEYTLRKLSKEKAFESNFPEVKSVEELETELALQQFIKNVEEIKKLAKIEKPKKITIMVAEEKKKDALKVARKAKTMKEYFEELKEKFKGAEKIFLKRKELFLIENEEEFWRKNAEWIAEYFNCEVVVEKEGKKQALPGKPGILIE